MELRIRIESKENEITCGCIRISSPFPNSCSAISDRSFKTNYLLIRIFRFLFHLNIRFIFLNIVKELVSFSSSLSLNHTSAYIPKYTISAQTTSFFYSLLFPVVFVSRLFSSTPFNFASSIRMRFSFFSMSTFQMLPIV